MKLFFSFLTLAMLLTIGGLSYASPPESGYDNTYIEQVFEHFEQPAFDTPSCPVPAPPDVLSADNYTVENSKSIKTTFSAQNAPASLQWTGAFNGGFSTDHAPATIRKLNSLVG